MWLLFEWTNFKDNLIEYKCLYCNKNYQHKFDKKLQEQFLIHTNFLTMTIISLFYYCEKGFILMNTWMIGKNSMKHYLKKKIFTVTYWMILLMEITGMQKEHKYFEIKNLGQYRDLYVQSNKLSLADVFVNFINMCLEIYELNPAKFLSAPGLAWQATLKKLK